MNPIQQSLQDLYLDKKILLTLLAVSITLNIAFFWGLMKLVNAL